MPELAKLAVINIQFSLLRKKIEPLEVLDKRKPRSNSNRQNNTTESYILCKY